MSEERTDDPLRVVVICGGLGAERSISLASGRAVTDALNARGHAAQRLELADSHEDAVDALLSLEWLDPRTGRRPGPFDVAFLALHGPFGEDGRVQTILDRTGLPYTGGGPHAMLLTWRKRLAKQRWHDAGLPTSAWVEVPRGALDEEREERGGEPDFSDWPFPLVVKPDAGGSSVGVSAAPTPAELPAALERAHAHDPIALCERFVPGEEWSVPLLDREALPPLKITRRASGDPYALFDYAAKYEDRATVIEPHTGGRIAERVAGVAVAAAEAVDAAGLVRVDLRVDEDGVPWLLELNAIPGFSPASQIPRSAAAAGFTPGELYEQCCRRALATA